MTMQLDQRATTDYEVVRPTRRRRWRIVVPLLLAAPLAAFAAVYFLFFTPDSPARLRLSDQSPAATGTAATLQSGSWSVGRNSVVGYRVREKLLSLPAPNDAVGRTNALTGGLRIERDAAGGVTVSDLHLTADVSTLKSDQDRRDDHMHTMAIESAKYPTATFVSTAPIVVPASVVQGGRATFDVAGNFTVHGVTKPVVIPVEAQRAGDRVEVVGSFTFGWDLFDMVRPNLSYVTVEADPTLEFQVFFDADSGRSLLGVGSEDSQS